MKILKCSLCVLLLLSASAWPMPLGSSARTVIPSDIQQIISVDYRALRNSPTALSLKERVLPENLKQFETALKSAGVNENDVDQLTFALFRTEKNGLKVIGVANGQFSPKAVLARFRPQRLPSWVGGRRATSRTGRHTTRSDRRSRPTSSTP